MNRFVDRSHAGRILASRLSRYGGRPDVVVLALPRGGVSVGFEVARQLGAPLDVCIVRKLGVPGREDLAMGAIASGGVRVLNPFVIETCRVPAAAVERVAAREKLKLEEGERLYRGTAEALPVDSRTVILVDDGLATGATMRAAVLAARKRNPASVVVAVPIAAREACEQFELEADTTVSARTPEPFGAGALWYEDFKPVEDSEVRELLQRARRGRGAAATDDKARHSLSLSFGAAVTDRASPG